MFNFGAGELVLILAVAFLVVGPKDLPKVARWLGRMVKRIRSYITELKKEVGWDELESELNEAKVQAQELREDVDVAPELKKIVAEARKADKDVRKTAGDAAKAANEVLNKT